LAILREVETGNVVLKTDSGRTVKAVVVERQDELAQVIGGLNPIRVFEFIALGAKKGVEPLEIMGVGGSHKRRDRFFRADQAVEYGLIDKIIDKH